MENTEEIKKLLRENKTEDAISILNEYIKKNSNDDEAFFLLGNAYRKKENWQMALNCYGEAMEINPSSPAALSYQMVIKVLDFYNKDMFNQ